MQATLSQGCQRVASGASARRSLCAPAFSGRTTTSRGLSVQVFAKGKGKGKTAFRQGSGMPNQAEMVRREPPTPEVDPENSEFVIFVRCLKYKDQMLNVDMGPSLWIPLSIVKGNQVSNFLANAMQSEWGRKLYGRTLIWQMASGIYKDRTTIERDLRKNFPPFANSASKDFQYAFKIRDKENPKDWTKSEDITILPAPEELGAVGIEQLKAFFSMENLATMFKAPEAPASSQ